MNRKANTTQNNIDLIIGLLISLAAFLVIMGMVQVYDIIVYLFIDLPGCK